MFDFLLTVIHELCRKSVTAKSEVVPATNTISYSKTSFAYEKSVLTIIWLFSDRVACRFYFQSFIFRLSLHWFLRRWANQKCRNLWRLRLIFIKCNADFSWLFSFRCFNNDGWVLLVIQRSQFKHLLHFMLFKTYKLSSSYNLLCFVTTKCLCHIFEALCTLF